MYFSPSDSSLEAAEQGSSRHMEILLLLRYILRYIHISEIYFDILLLLCQQHRDIFPQNLRYISTKYEIYFDDEELTFVQPSNFHLSNCAAVVASRVKCIYPPLTFAGNPFKISERSLVERQNRIYLVAKVCEYACLTNR